ncbi:hypothetical protein R3P38DRAFT_3235528 [Favolaschia claudopus]|uniref:Uncharacterized protein n=1 Tax=Favolaschia claudopus TaxID=2862362 RepID=A0AAV9ZCP8_9AGAR
MQRSRIPNPTAIPAPPRRASRESCVLALTPWTTLKTPTFLSTWLSAFTERSPRQDPSLPFPGEPFAHGNSPAPPSKLLPVVQPLRSPQRKRVRQREEARSAALREKRFRTMEEIALAVHYKHPDPPSLFPGPLPHSQWFHPRPPTFTIEDRDYELAEVLGADSRFQLRSVDWRGCKTSLELQLGERVRLTSTYRDVRVVASEARAVIVLVGPAPPRRKHFVVVIPKTDPVLFTGVGHYFNELKPTRYHGSRVLDVLSTLSLFSTVPMKRLVSFTNSVLEAYCPTAFSALEDQKAQMLAYDPDAVYPCETSVFSAITLELGGPHHIISPFGPRGRFDPATWCIITSLGVYDPRLGGHIILWDIGWVLVFPPGTSILLPPGFVALSLIQYAGSGIRRFFENGERKDEEFAAEATREEHLEREMKRRECHLAAKDGF